MYLLCEEHNFPYEIHKFIKKSKFMGNLICMLFVYIHQIMPCLITQSKKHITNDYYHKVQHGV